MKKFILKRSSKPSKRFVLIMPREGHQHHFGAKHFKKGTYIDHKDDKLKRAWIARHKGDKNYNNVHSGIFYSRNLLWNKKTLKESIKDMRSRYNIDIKVAF